MLRWPRSTFAFPVSRFHIRPHLCLAFPVRPHLCFAFPISHSALIRASRFPFVLICASRFPFLIPPSFAPRVSRSSSFVLRVSHFSFRPHSCLAFPVRPHLCFAFPISHSALIRASHFPFVLICALISHSALIRAPNFSPPRPPSFVSRISHLPVRPHSCPEFLASRISCFLISSPKQCARARASSGVPLRMRNSTHVL